MYSLRYHLQLRFFLLFICSLFISSILAQNCGFTAGDGCAGTDYTNAFMRSTNNPATIEYDNWVSLFHSSFVRRSNGVFMAWGEDVISTGNVFVPLANALSPIEINSTNYPLLGSAKVLKVTGGSYSDNNSQFVLLASNGLYAWGQEGRVISNDLTTSQSFQKITVNGQSNGLPPGISPSNVKMMTGSSSSLCIVTCSGDVWMLSSLNRAEGGTGSETVWSRVTTAPGVFLTNIVAARVSYYGVIALRSDNTLWTWGNRVYRGNNTAVTTLNRATQMTHPDPTKIIKMIATNSSIDALIFPNQTFYVLMTDGNLYALGSNDYNELGDFTSTERLSWIQPRYNSSTGPVMNNIHWLSVNEHDHWSAAVNVLTKSGTPYSWGSNDRSMIGGVGDPSSPRIPNGISITDSITGVQSGGHTSMVSRCGSVNFGYVGHRINGSMGNGSSANVTESSYTFATANVPICASTVAAELYASSSVTPAYGAGLYSTFQRVPLISYPSGGTYSIISGPGTLLNDTIRFTGAGSVQVRYTTTVCGLTTSSTLTLNSASPPLPLELIYFSGSAENCLAKLNWKTSSEQNTEAFFVEKSTDGINWTAIQRIAAQGNGPGQDYSFTTSQTESKIYYRLKMVDNDGSFTYSGITSIYGSCMLVGDKMIVYPNPVSFNKTSQVNIIINSGYSGKAKILLYDALGKLLVAKAISLSSRSYTPETIEFTSTRGGVYIVKVIDSNGKLILPAQKLFCY